MKYSIYIFLLFAVAISSCKKYLEQVPDNRTQLDSPEKVAQLLGTAYPQASYITFAESISDNVEDKGAGVVLNINLNPFFFQDVQDQQQDSPEFYWNACYTAIAASNQALATCMAAPDSQNYRTQKGEALVTRAFSHFMLVNFFSKFYDATTAGTDPGIPYVTEPEKVVFKNYDRKTVQYVYDMVEKDLTEGLPLLKDQAYTVPRYHFNLAAAHAFAARFYLFKKDYDKVIEHASAAFPNNNFADNMRPWNTTYQTLSFYTLLATYTKATEPANLLLTEMPSNYARNYATFRYGLSYAKQRDILGANVTGGRWAYSVFYYGAQDYFVPKFNEYFVTTSINANTGIPYIMQPELTTEEVLLSRAEAYIYKNNTAAATADLNTFVSKRILSYSPSQHNITATKLSNFYGTSDLQTGLLLATLDFRRAEYVMEGLRWFDLQRYKIPVEHLFYDGSTKTLSPTDPYRVFQIPESATLSGIALNPR